MALQFRSAAIRATAAVALVEVATHFPSEGRSSLAYHRFFDRAVTPLGRRLLDPEAAHHLALEVARRGWAPRLSREGDEADARAGVDMAVEIGGGGGRRALRFDGPVGLAAGFDKDGTAIAGLFGMGFSFVEIGSVTPLPQPGNPRPRSFRLVEDRGVINRFGFNSEGVGKVGEHLRDYCRGVRGIAGDLKENSDEKNAENGVKDEDGHAKGETISQSFLWALRWVWHRILASDPRTGVLGVNLGKNKTSEDEVGVSTLSFYGIFSMHMPASIANCFRTRIIPLASRSLASMLDILLSTSLLRIRLAYAPSNSVNL